MVRKVGTFVPHLWMAKLTEAQRHALPTSVFAIPETRSYPIQDRNHAKAALSEVAQHGTAAERAKVRRAVHRRYPDMGSDRRSAYGKGSAKRPS